MLLCSKLVKILIESRRKYANSKDRVAIVEVTMPEITEHNERVTSREKDFQNQISSLRTDIAVLRTELRWIKYLLFALVALNLPNIAAYIPTTP